MSARAWLLALGVSVLAVAVAATWLRSSDNLVGEAPELPGALKHSTVVEHGRALVVLGDCQGCHTSVRGAPFAGGRAIPTAFGTFFAPNITPDPTTGIGKWSAEDFWHALHNGYSRDGRVLYPAFPYTNYTRVSRRDADAIFEYLRTLAPVVHRNLEHELHFPYNIRLLVHAWRWLFFRPGVYEPEPARDATWNRGAYLVQGLAHCSACHEARNALGAVGSRRNPSGGLVLSWYAPSLENSGEAGLQGWSEEAVSTLLSTGQAMIGSGAHRQQAVTLGPMSEVVYDSLQNADPMDTTAMARYLRSLPDSASPRSRSQPFSSSLAERVQSGAVIYADRCASCHGDHGEGRFPIAPALAGNRAVLMPSALNAIRATLFGGYPPATLGNPRPFGMPPFYPSLSDTEIANVLSFMRVSWGNSAPAVTASEVHSNRGSPLW